MATDPKKIKELKDEQLEETAGGRIVEAGPPRLEHDGTAQDASGTTDAPRMSV